ncbi:MAG: hypothetical protein IT334_05335 [Thermomicrobiales bacterium]|nr:hypothetical protein [Thermomicrobiales bacterium]
MDGQQFDRFARALGSGRSRRSLFKGAAAAWIGLVAGGKVIEHAEAGEEVACLADGVGCNSDGGRDEVGGCCFGSWCNFITNVCEQVTCAQPDWGCGFMRAGILIECCEGYNCVLVGKGDYCVPAEVPVCIEEGNPCGEVTPAQEGGSGDCCVGLICNEESICAPPPPLCAPAGGSCVELDCCQDSVCLDTGICGTRPDEPPPPPPPVTTLPDTGAGQNGQGAEWLIPTALGAAAAAVVGGKLLKGEKASSEDLA